MPTLEIESFSVTIYITMETIKEIKIADSAYPESLRQIHKPPPVFFMLGEIKPEDKNAVAIVGARKCTTYGKQVAYDLAYELAKLGVTIVSGMALGIDGEAHKGALDAGGRTIAVLGSGVDDKSIYPHTHISLAKKIAEQGAVISEFEPGSPSYPSNFPQRNRIVSALSLGLVVVEAGEKSGSLITANFALEQGKDVFAVPGPIYSPASAGANHLIQQGAKLIRNAQDILEELNIEFSEVKTKKIGEYNMEEGLIITALESESLNTDAIIKITGLNPAVALTAITMLELKKIIKNIGNNVYTINH